MATVKRLKIVRWYLTDATDPTLRRNVPAKTEGAVKVTELSSTYFIVWKEGGRTKREATGLTDKRAAQAHLLKWDTARQHGRTGILDPYQTHLDRAIDEHLADYLVTLRDRSDAHRKEAERVCREFIKTAAVEKLRDFTAARVTEYLTNHPASAATRAKHRVYLSGFCSYLFACDRIPANPIDRVERPRAGAKEPDPRTRRAYTVDELKRLMHAAREYPLVCRSRNKGGRPRSDGSPAQPKNPVQLTDEYRAKLIRDGKERELVYRLFLTTGLRRGELSRVTVGMLDTRKPSLPKLVLPKRILKHKPKHVSHVVIPLVRTLARELSQFVVGRAAGERLVNVPDKSNYIHEHQARLKFAEIEYQTSDGYADIHAFRTTANMYLKRKGVSLEHRMRFARHSCRDITTKHYDTSNRQPMTMGKMVFAILTKLDELVTA